MSYDPEHAEEHGGFVSAPKQVMCREVKCMQTFETKEV